MTHPKRRPVDQVIQAMCHRARAVLLTTLSTTLGLAPLLLESAQQAKWVHPFAISIIFGLLYAMIVLSLGLPAVVALVEKKVVPERRQ